MEKHLLKNICEEVFMKQHVKKRFMMKNRKLWEYENCVSVIELWQPYKSKFINPISRLEKRIYH